MESMLACAMANEQQHLQGQANAAATAGSLVLASWWEWLDEVDLMISAVDPAVVRQAEIYQLDLYPNRSAYPPEDIESSRSQTIGSVQSRILLEAAQLAIISGIRKVIWPVRIQRPESEFQVEQAIDLIGSAIDRALLASRLASLDADTESAVDVVIETPFVDLSNNQMADLAQDLSLSIDSTWWHSARTLPLAQTRQAFWSAKLKRSSTIHEPKPQQRAQL
jgi:hypothetical protein